MLTSSFGTITSSYLLNCSRITKTHPYQHYQQRTRKREVANLDPNTIVGNSSGSPARNTRARFAVAAASLAAVVSNNQASAHQWEHKKYNPMPQNLELNEIADAVLEGDKMLIA